MYDNNFNFLINIKCILNDTKELHMCAPTLRNCTSNHKLPTLEDMIETFRNEGVLTINIDNEGRLLRHSETLYATHYGIHNNDGTESLPCDGKSITFEKGFIPESDVIEILSIALDRPSHNSSDTFNYDTSNKPVTEVSEKKEIIPTDRSHSLPVAYKPLKDKLLRLYRASEKLDTYYNNRYNDYHKPLQSYVKENILLKHIVRELSQCNDNTKLNYIANKIKKHIKSESALNILRREYSNCKYRMHNMSKIHVYTDDNVIRNISL